MARIVCLGEAMLELSQEGELWRMGYGGDTLNTAIHLSRSGQDVAYMTAVGADPFSNKLQDQLQAEGIDCGLVFTHPAKHIGLYAISTDAEGERNFSYWRESSAARDLFALGKASLALATAGKTDLFSFSLISLAILPDEGRRALIDLAGQVKRAGGKVAFDSNYRATLWQGTEAAKAWRDEAVGVSDIGLPTFEDEQALSGDVSPEAVAARWTALGCGEVIVKMGARGCRLSDGSIVEPDRILVPIDTSGAGDAFNAGYLSSRMNHKAPIDSARAGHAFASWVIMRRGAIPAQDQDAPYQM